MPESVIAPPPDLLPRTLSSSGHKNFSRYAWALLAYNVVVVLWGAFVRASGSGDGCGNHWPLCNGAVTPNLLMLATIIEFTHRAMTGLDTPLVAVLIWWAFRAFPRGNAVRRWAVFSGAFLILEGLIGAALVKFGLVTTNASGMRAAVLSIHLVNTLTLLACLALTARYAGEDFGMRPKSGRSLWSGLGSLAAVVLLGVSGVMAALADTLFPTASLASGFLQDFSSSSSLFVRLRALHPILAAGVGLWLVFYATSASAQIRRARRLAWAVTAVVGAQIIAGVINVFLLAPVWMQIIHLLLADALWITLVLLVAENIGETEAKAPASPRR
jgi:heme A synthase